MRNKTSQHPKVQKVYTVYTGISFLYFWVDVISVWFDIINNQ